ncbi:hypothetical protein SNEBB_010447 [Seison nebaliae]|nr:hypothetical protein SNEBB_010447 [Seison nebaliae]
MSSLSGSEYTRNEKVNPLVTSKWLKERVQSRRIFLIDCSYPRPSEKDRDCYKEYLHEHIPSAIFFNIDECSEPAQPHLHHMLPSVELFTKYISKFGLHTKRTQVVVYDNDTVSGCFSACRVWFLFRYMGYRRVSVLDGGLPAWKSNGYETTHYNGEKKNSKIMTFHPDFSCKISPKLVVTREMLEKQTDNHTHKYRVVDARAKERFDGTGLEPRPACPSGHIPGAINIPFGDLLNKKTKMFLSVDELKEYFANIKINCSSVKKVQDANKHDSLETISFSSLLSESSRHSRYTVVCMCGTGITSCIIFFALYLCGCRNLAIYDGSWLEWSLMEPPQRIENYRAPAEPITSHH